MKTVLIGSVGSSKLILEEMIKIRFPISMVFSLDETHSANVSDYYPIHILAEKHNIPYKKFGKINDNENIDLIKEIEPDYIFAIGISQLISREIINIATKGVIGFHPTPLPKFRGRAAIAWQILLDVEKSKCTLFFIDDGIDSGDIIEQEDYLIEATDYASDVMDKCLDAFCRLLNRTLPKIMYGCIKPIKQNELEATYLLKRIPEDGRINWDKSAKEIQKLIRAVSKPYPGAFSVYDGSSKIIFWKADYCENDKYYGTPGQIAKVNSDYIDIVCTDGLLRVYVYENSNNVKLIEGHKFK